jgi:hypothetical protein
MAAACLPQVLMILWHPVYAGAANHGSLPTQLERIEQVVVAA